MRHKIVRTEGACVDQTMGSKGCQLSRVGVPGSDTPNDMQIDKLRDVVQNRKRTKAAPLGL